MRLAIALFAISASLMAAPPVNHPNARHTRSNIPLGFEANAGQAPATVRFTGRAPGIGIHISPQGALLRLGSGSRSATLRMKASGANPAPRIEAIDKLPGKSNYFLGPNPAAWRTDVANFAKVAYRSVYPGVDLIFYGARSGHLEYDFVVVPGADPAPIGVEFEGASSIRLDADGGAIIAAAGVELRQPKPHIYQTIDGCEVPVEGRFVLKGRNRLGFELARYDARHALVIDPVMIYASLIGGAFSYDEGWGIAVDSAGNAYITGRTYGSGFPVVGGVAASGEAFITKINAAGTAIVYSTYISGPIGYAGAAIAVDSAGSAYITGQTFGGLPVVNAAQPSVGGSYDAYVLKLNPAGNGIVYSTYLGGNGPDRGFGIAVDSSGNAYVTGEAGSTDFPLVGAVDSTMSGGDAFLTKVGVAGSSFVYSTFIGGEAMDSGTAVAVDSTGSAVVTGLTSSSAFPVVNAFQPTFGGYYDMFATRLNPAGNAMVYSTYMGGNWWDNPGNSIAFDASGNAWIAGTSASSNFPTSGAFQATHAGANDVVLLALSPAGSLVYSTYVGGSSDDRGEGVAVLPTGQIVVAGQSWSSDFPTVNPLQAAVAGYQDVLVFALNRATNKLTFSTFWGGPYQDWARNIAVDGAGSIYVTGVGESSLFPVVNPVLPSPEGFNAFVAKIGTANLAVTSLTTNLPLTSPSSALRLTATVANNGAFDHSGVALRVFLDTDSSGVWDVGEPAQEISFTNLTAGASRSATMSFTAPPGGSYQAVAVADPANLVVEASEDDNTAVAPVVIARPDYAVTGFTSSATPAGAPGKFNVSLNATIANLGMSSATNVQVRFSISSDGGATWSDIGGPVSAGNIGAGSSAAVTATFRNAVPGSYLVRATVDPGGVILENDETNNSATFPLVL